MANKAAELHGAEAQARAAAAVATKEFNLATVSPSAAPAGTTADTLYHIGGREEEEGTPGRSK